MKKKTKIILIISVILIIIILGILAFFYYLKNRKIDVIFSLKGESNITLEVGTVYEDEGFNITADGKKVDKDVKIINKVKTDKLGTYEIVYLYVDKYKKSHEIKRYINIIDTISPQIVLKGSSEIKILLNEKYEEPGFEVTDNYDENLIELVNVDSNLDTSKVGDYIITYSVDDNSGNHFEIQRKIKVIKPKPVVTYTETKSKEVSTDKNTIISKATNTITKNQFTDTGISYEGYIKNSNGTYKILLKNNSNSYEFNMKSIGENNYSGNINLTDIQNGNYEVYVLSNEEERLMNLMESIDRIVRAKINNKLVTLSYENNNVSIDINDFNYQYDILIDPGHGGFDSGAVNQYIEEKEMNLRVSLYEKCRYEEHGYSVYMVRTNDTYGVQMGDSSWKSLTKRSYAIGYNGVVSKIVYSNHHNNTASSKTSGYEILTPAQISNLNPELSIVSRFNQIYPLKENHNRVYTRDYDNGKIYSTAGAATYNIRNYYATIRIPYELFNVKSITYEGCYMSNIEDYNWYWNEENWKKVSEIKIEEYIKYLGGTYNSSTSCN